MFPLTIALSLLVVTPQDDEAQLVGYFLKNVTEHKMVLDRESDCTTVSIAATGFGYNAWVYAVRRGLMPRQRAVAWMNESLDFVQKTNPTKNRGWLYHFTDPRGRPKFYSEVSSIDTAIFYAGAHKAALDLDDEFLRKKVDRMIAAVDVNLLLDNGYFHHGWLWVEDRRVVFTSVWDSNSEGVILYRLFHVEFTPRFVRYDLPLFVYYYPLCFFDDPELEETLCKAVQYQLKTHGVVGITACDGPQGYCVGDPRVISPLAVWAASRYSEQARDYLGHLKVPRVLPSLALTTRKEFWDRLGIDVGSTLMVVTSGPTQNGRFVSPVRPEREVGDVRSLPPR